MKKKRKHIKREKRKNDVEILHSHPDTVFRSAEQGQKLYFERKEDRNQDNACNQGKGDAAANRSMCVLHILFSLTNV